jgi:hypothetical protein
MFEIDSIITTIMHVFKRIKTLFQRMAAQNTVTPQAIDQAQSHA